MKPAITFFLLLFGVALSYAQPLRLHFAGLEAVSGDTFCISIRAENFDTIGSFQFSLQWDTAGLTYLGIGQKDLPAPVAVGETESGNGILRVSWFDPQGKGVTLADESAIMDICFLAKGCEGSFSLNFSGNPLPIEVYRIQNAGPQNIGLEPEDDEAVISPKDLVSLFRDTFLCPGVDLVLDAFCDGCTYLWSDGSTTPQLIPEDEGIFSVTVTDAQGCTDSDSVKIIPPPTNPLDILGIVNVITPNGDGFNDALVFERLEKYPRNRLIVFNRWGGEVFRANGYLNDWAGEHRGKALPAGVYFYELTISNGQEQFTVKNALTIIRQ